MLKIKKYANGRFFDTAAKKYIKADKLAEMIENGEKIQVTLTKTGKDITDAVTKQLTKKGGKKKAKKKIDANFLKTDKLTNWLSEVIDTKIDQIMDAVKLPTREQVENLEKSITELNKKIDALKASQDKAAKKTTAKEKAPAAKEA